MEGGRVAPGGPFSVNFQRNAEMAPSKFADASNEGLVQPLPLPMS
jgi:hypothetical protein